MLNYQNDARRALSSIVTNCIFLDDQYDAMYRTEQRVAALAAIFAGIAIAVACLGLLALASFTALQRSKGISIRKVLGGTSGGIVLLLSKGYVRLMLMAFIAAVPISYFLLDRWLENFAFRITIAKLHSVVLKRVLRKLVVDICTFFKREPFPCQRRPMATPTP